MPYDSPTIASDVTLGHSRDSRASRVPTPTPTPTKTVQHAEGVDLGEEPEKGPLRSGEPAAARRRQEPRASRHEGPTYSDADFRRLCALARAVRQTNREGDADLKEAVTCAAARARLRYDAEVINRVLDHVQPPRRSLTLLQAEPPRVHWRARCAHTPTCQTPTQCALAPRGGR